jgi:hypothetical protein
MRSTVSALTSSLTVIFLLCSLAAASEVKIVTPTLPPGNVNTPYSVTITTSGGSVPFVWWVSTGSLPPGLSLIPYGNSRSAVLSGTPTVAANYQFSISVKGRAGHSSTVTYALTIQAPLEHIVDLLWQASVGDDIVGYNVYRSTVHGGPYAQINVLLVAATLFSDSTVVDGATYYYVTTSVDPEGAQSPYSNEAEAQIPGN